MDEYIIDFQAFKDGNNKYVLKELAVISIRRAIIGHFLIKSPFDVKKLPADKRSSVNYLIDHHHGIRWEDGYITFKELVTLICDITANASQIFIKGNERARFIEKLTNKPTIDLDTLKCPRAKFLQVEPSTPDCFYYRHSADYHSYFEACSLRRVYKLKNWYKEYIELKTKPNNSLEEADQSEDTSQDEYSGTEEEYDIAPRCSQKCLRR